MQTMNISHDDMYHDRTWFDELGAWLLLFCQRHVPRSRGQLWSTGFTLFAGLCVAWAAGLVTHCIFYDVAINEYLAQLLASALLLVAARHFLAATGMSASSALARHKLIRRTRSVPQSAAVQVQARTSVTSSPRVPDGRSKPALKSATDPKEFFRAVKNAGINVRIARSLYAAGFRSGEQVRECKDAHLLGVDGIGHATLHKLRLQFGLHRDDSKPQSNAA